MRRSLGWQVLFWLKRGAFESVFPNDLEHGFVFNPQRVTRVFKFTAGFRRSARCGLGQNALQCLRKSESCYRNIRHSHLRDGTQALPNYLLIPRSLLRTN
jgi:hypothetical protein